MRFRSTGAQAAYPMLSTGALAVLVLRRLRRRGFWPSLVPAFRTRCLRLRRVASSAESRDGPKPFRASLNSAAPLVALVLVVGRNLSGPGRTRRCPWLRGALYLLIRGGLRGAGRPTRTEVEPRGWSR